MLNTDGRPIGVSGKEELVYADTMIIAINQGSKDKFVKTTHGLEASPRGLLITNDHCMTTRKGGFAAGDVVHGSHTVAEATAEARIAAEMMMRYMEAQPEEEQNSSS